ncbi:MAG: phosphoribosylglycinamide formyltransferase [Longimicrobiales bacterium]
MSGRIAVFASGSGTNLQALLDHFNGSVDRGGRIVLVISDRSNAAALRRAANAGVMTREIGVAGRAGDAVSAETLAALAAERVDVIALAGYLRLIPADVIARYRGRMVNIHPALLPSFGGAGMYGHRVHQAVIDAGCMVSGATVHHVDEKYDEGAIVAQWPVPVLPDDAADTLAARVLQVEHMLYPVALEALLRRLGDFGGGDGAAQTADTGLVFNLVARESGIVDVMKSFLSS